MTRRDFRTPPLLPETTQTRCITIPASQEWLGLVNAALLFLTQEWRYEQVEPTDMTAADTAARALEMYVAYLGECAGDMQLRQNPENPCILEASVDGEHWGPWADTSLCQPEARPPLAPYDDIQLNAVTGEPEVSFDGGSTWIPVPDDGPNGWWPARSPTPGATQEEQRCLATTYAVENLNQMYRATYGQFAASLLTTMSSFKNFLDQLQDLVLGVTYGSYYGILKAAGFFEISEAAQYTAAELSEAARDDLACLLYENSSVGAFQVVSFDYNAIRDNVIAAVGINPGTAIWTHLNYLGEEGLNRAGDAETGFAELYDCAACGEPETWCKLWVVPPDCLAGPWVRTWGQCEGGYWTESAYLHYRRLMAALTNFDFGSSVLTKFEVDMSNTGGTNQALIVNGVWVANWGGAGSGWKSVNVNLTGVNSLGVYIDRGGAGNSVIGQFRLSGTGPNPFGEDDC